MHKRFSPEQENEVVAAYQAGLAQAELLTRFSCSTTALYRALRAHGITPARKRGVSVGGTTKLTAGQVVELCSHYQSGDSTCKLAARYGVGVPAICGLLRRRGVELRHPKGVKYSRTHDSHAFDILTPESSYWIGFLMADGNVWKHHVSLHLAAGDALHVGIFRQFLKSNHAVSRAKEGAAQFCVASRPLAVALAGWGVVPRKSHDAEVSDTLMFDRDFWRGVVDGDGTVGICKDGHGNKYPTLRLCGSAKLMAQFLAFVEVHAPGKSHVLHCGPIYQVALQGQRATKIIGILYRDCGGLALQRKLESAKRILHVRYLKEAVA